MVNDVIEVGKVTSEVANESIVIAEKSLIQARGIVISTDNSYISCGESLKADKQHLAFIEKERKKATDPLDEVKKTIMGWFKPAKDNLEKAIQIKGSAMMAWDNKKQELTRIENARLADIARKEAEKLAERARKAQESGKVEKAAELLAQAQMKQAVVPTVQAEAPKIAGLTTRDNWTFEVVDINLVPREYLCTDDKKIGQVVRATKGTLAIPGIKVIKETKMAGSR